MFAGVGSTYTVGCRRLIQCLKLHVVVVEDAVPRDSLLCDQLWRLLVASTDRPEIWRDVRASGRESEDRSGSQLDGDHATRRKCAFVSRPKEALIAAACRERCSGKVCCRCVLAVGRKVCCRESWRPRDKFCSNELPKSVI